MDKIEVAKLLVSLGCVQVSPDKPFTYASGLTGPIYTDNRQLLSHPDARTKIAKAFAELIQDSDFKYESLAGLATAGIPHAALVADRLNVPMIYVRGKPKAHGKGNQVEGAYSEGDQILLIEDLVNQGSSLAEAIEGVRNVGLKPIACLCIVDYQMKKAGEVSANLDVPIISLTNFETIAKVSLESGKIDQAGHDELYAWKNKH